MFLCAALAASGCVELRHLALQDGAHMVTPPVLRHLAAQCVNLHVLNLSLCNITDELLTVRSRVAACSVLLSCLPASFA
jgi:hypothetical protein